MTSPSPPGAWAVLLHFQRPYDVFATVEGGVQDEVRITGVHHMIIPFDTEASARIGMSDVITTIVPLLGRTVQGEVVKTDDLEVGGQKSVQENAPPRKEIEGSSD